MRREARALIGICVLTWAWCFLLDDDTRSAIAGTKPRDVIDVEAH